MKLTLIRTDCLKDRTPGILYNGHRQLCDTLEPPVTPNAHHRSTAIPAGTYPLRITYSPRFKTHLPLIMNVPERSGIRIHAGNTPMDTSGCILVGERDGNTLIGSRHTLQELLKILSPNEPHTITIA